MSRNVQRGKIVTHLAVVDAQEFVGAGGHVDVVRLTFGALASPACSSVGRVELAKTTINGATQKDKIAGINRIWYIP